MEGQKKKTGMVGDWGTGTSTAPLPTAKKPEEKIIKKKSPIVEEMKDRRKKKKDSRSGCGCW